MLHWIRRHGTALWEGKTCDTARLGGGKAISLEAGGGEVVGKTSPLVSNS
jgi:hypothetical protein